MSGLPGFEAEGPPAPARTVIAVPTFRRPDQLRHLLDAVAAMEGLAETGILIADNDAAGRAGAAAAASIRDAGYRLPIDIIVVPQPGLCHVRNAIADRALATPGMQALAMIDDDEWPEPQWLSELLRVQRKTGAGVVGGPVVPHFTEGAPDWAEQTLVFRPEVRAEGAAEMLYASNNLLIPRETLEGEGPPWFDARFNRSGGEDLDFLTRLKARGVRFAWAPEAKVSEWVGSERARRAWVLRRMWRIGITDTIVASKQRPGLAGRTGLAARSLALLGLRTAELPSLAWRRRRRLDVAGQWVKAVGRLYALAGGSDAIYAAPAPVSSNRS